MQTPTPKEQISYTQVVDEKTGEIKYVPNNPPTPPPQQSQPGNDKDAEGNEIDRRGVELFDAVRDAIDLNPDEKLAEILARLEANNKRLRYATRLKSGKLDGRRLCAYKTSEHLFKKKAIKHKDYQFTIMIDTSGSMFDCGEQDYDDDLDRAAKSKLKVAFESVIKVVNALEELKIPVSVMAMNQEFRILKEFNDKLLIPDFMRRAKLNVLGLCDGESNMGGTNEMTAYKETIAYIDRNTQSKKENVVLVLSDGEPGGKHGSVPVYLEDEIKQTREASYGEGDNQTLRNYWDSQSKVTAYGIGIMSAARQIPRSMRLDKVEKLPEVLSGLIQEIIL